MGKPLHQSVIPETFVHLLYDYLDAQGAASGQVLGQARPLPHAHGVGSIALQRWAALLQRAALHLGDPLLGLHLGQTIAPRHLGVLGYVLLACDNLAAAMQRLDHYQRLIFDAIPMTQRAGPGYIELVWEATDVHTGALVDETGITVLVQFCRSLTGVPVSPLFVQFPNPQPAELQPYLDWYGCQVHFGGNETVVRVSLATLALPLKSADPGLIAHMERQAELLLAQLPQEEAVIEQVRAITVRLLHDGEPDIEAVAAKLCCTPRTVQRRLKAVGSSFRQELALVRRQLAENYLRDPRLNIAEIALLLGYSEHSAFSRSYKEWTGLAPQQWRDESARGEGRRSN